MYGNSCSKKHRCDNGAIRLVNNSKSAVQVKSVVVKLSTCTFNSWPHNISIGAGKQVILSNEGDKGRKGCSSKVHGFDTSEVGPHGKFWGGHCTNSGVTPEVLVSTASGTETFKDTGKVLNTGGVDSAHCPKGTKGHNESIPWTLIGAKPCPSETLSLAPPSQKHAVKQAATVTATLKDAGGKHCGHPLQGAVVKFSVTSGPNKGKTGKSVTNTQGKAKFTYSSNKTGTDKLRAATTNPAGTIRSNSVKVIWVKAAHHHHKHRAGTFSCQGIGTAVPLLGSKFVFAVANPKDKPCKTDKASVAHVSTTKALGLTANAVASHTYSRAGKLPKAGDLAEATAKVARANLSLAPGEGLVIGAVTSQAKETCVSKAGKLTLERSSKSNVAWIKLAGNKQLIGNKPQKIVIPGIATIWLNRTIKTGSTLIQRAVEIDLLGKPAVILAQSQVDFTGNPCGTTTG